MQNTAEESKPQRGGKRIGSGRKPSTLNGIVKKLPKETAALLLVEIKANQKWKNLAESEDERIQLDTLKYLTDRAYGKPPQSLDLGGQVEVIKRVFSDI
jgi:hypothetical protein